MKPSEHKDDMLYVFLHSLTRQWLETKVMDVGDYVEIDSEEWEALDKKLYILHQHLMEDEE